MNKIGVIYLSYVPYGVSYFANFLESYSQHETGASHSLIIVFNGFSNQNELLPFTKLIKSYSINHELIFAKSKFDIDVYYYVATRYSTFSSFVFLNTYSTILADKWLYYLSSNLLKNNVGCVSATGAWGDFRHRDDYLEAIGRLKRFIFRLVDIKKVIYFKFNFYPQVDVHLRTNAFMIDRELFLSIVRPKVKPLILSFLFGLNAKKLRSFCFEHGMNSFSKQLIERGYLLQLVDKFGNGVNIEDWAKSNIFWSGMQENLLIKDNQTSKYELANSSERKLMRYAAWNIKD